jgi:hypothetical protein
VSRYTRSPQTTGEAEPRPGISIFQRTFFVSLHSVGGVAVRDTPVMCGPRHWAQYLSAGACAESAATATATMEIMGKSMEDIENFFGMVTAL